MESSVFHDNANGLAQKQVPDQKKGKIVFGMIEAGGGHKSPALAVQEAVNTLYGNTYEILVVDFMKDLGCTELDLKHKEAWKFFLAHPFLCKSSHILADLTGPVFRAGLKQYYLYPFYSYVLQFLIKYRPSVIFSTHPFNSYAVEYVRKKFNVSVTLINYLTELFDASSLWVIKGVDYYIVSSEEAKRKLVLRGIPREKLKVFGYPVRQAFFNISSTKEEIAARFGVDTSKKTLLMSFGKEGIGNIERFIDALVKKDVPLNVIVVTGGNEELKLTLGERYRNCNGRSSIVVTGFTDKMNELMHLSDFCFIKPGPSTTMEAITLKKPILFYKAAQISESPNIRYVVENNVGHYIGDNVKKFMKVFRSLSEGGGSDAIRRSYGSLKVENGAYDIARFLVSKTFGAVQR